MSETFQEYSARLLSNSAGKDPFTILEETPARIGALLAGRSAEDLRWTTSPARWSIAQIVAHLADAEIVGAFRFRMILAAPGTPIQAFDQDGWAREMAYEARDAAASLALFTALRTAQLELLRGLDDEKLDRFGMHAERGKESVRHLLSLYAGHDLNHVAQIERLIAERDPGGARRRDFTPAPVKAALEPGTLEKIDVRAGTIRAAAPVSGADRLAVLTVDFGDRTRSIVAGIRTERPLLAAVVGAQALFVINLPPKTIRQVSEGMLFDVGFADGLRPAFAQPEWPVPDGVRPGSAGHWMRSASLSARPLRRTPGHRTIDREAHTISVFGLTPALPSDLEPPAPDCRGHAELRCRRDATGTDHFRRPAGRRRRRGFHARVAAGVRRRRALSPWGSPRLLASRSATIGSTRIARRAGR